MALNFPSGTSAAWTLVGLALSVAGCGGMAIDGVVVDQAGQPVADAAITVLETPCQAKSDASGVFSLSCTPGAYNLTISQVGYVSATLEGFDASERKRYDLGRQVLVRIPEQKGLLLFSGAEFKPLEPGLLERSTGGAGQGQYRHYCLDRDGSKPNQLSAGVHVFYDHESTGWRAFRLDDEGCAYRMSPNSPTSWGVDYSEKAEVKTTQLERDLVRADITFEVGEYFFADWEQGFFTKAKGEDHRYSGSWVVVK